ncbi:hypothetical protein OAory_01054350 [Aspergillus oryzae]|uniref:DUF7726 domain-containing protein n=1 Tax=Aspergillus oryzae TaxID=5062 RepID=A0A1S9DKL7_ASPOZ|nr:hypothetical protein OAory_01054350 [Aspergillus oryzae]
MPRAAKKASARAPLDAADPSGLVSQPQPPISTSHIPDVREKKRKADASEPEELEEIDEDPRLDTLKWNCTQVRRKIKNLIESKEMKIGEFQEAIGFSSRSYNTFLKMTGEKGSESNTYFHAHRFCLKRELQGIKEPKKKPASKQAKLDTEKKYDVSGIHLPGEEESKVQVYDTCDEVRKKIYAHLRDPNVTKAGFLREIVKSYTPEQAVKFQGNSLTRFLDMSGANAGNTNAVFYPAYVFFEKLRICDGQPKNKFREEMEKIWRSHGGFGIETPHHKGYWCHASEFVYVDKYGQTGFGKRR